MKNAAAYPSRLHRRKIILEKTKRISWSIIRTVIIIGLCFEILYPFLIKILQAFMTTSDLLDPTVKIFPREFSLASIVKTFQDINFIHSFFNSFILSFSLSVIQLFVCTTIGYGFARFRFRLNSFFFVMLIITLVIPIQLYNTSAFIYFKNLNLIGNIIPFYILSATGLGMKNGLFVFLMRQFFRGLPKELEDAAYIDGCGYYKTFFRIILPNARTSILTVLLFSVVWYWNDYFMTSMYTSINTVSTALSMLAESSVNLDSYIKPSLLQSGCLLVMLPLLILYLCCERFFTGGIERSGIVG